MINLKASRLRALYDNDEYHVFTAKADGSFNEVIEELTGEDKEELIDDLIYCIQDLVKNPHQTETIRECKKAFRRMEDKQPTIYVDGDWIPCNKRLPEVPEGLEDMYCPEFNVTIKGAKEATTLKYSCDGTWFDDNGNIYDVVAWQPLPDAYKEQA